MKVKICKESDVFLRIRKKSCENSVDNDKKFLFQTQDSN